MFSKAYKIFNFNIKICSKRNNKRAYSFLDRAFSLFERLYISAGMQKTGRSNKILFITDKKKLSDYVFYLYGSVIRKVREAMTGKAIFIHSSSVALGEKNIIFIGRGGSGKSTLAASFMKTEKARVLSDELSVIDILKKTLIPFPTIPGIKDKTYYNARPEYRSFLDRLLKKYGSITVDNISLLTESEFEECLKYFEELYDIKRPFKDYSSNKFVFIFLEEKSDFIKPRLKGISYSEAIGPFLKALVMAPEIIDRVVLKNLIAVFSSGSCYMLKPGSIEKTSDLIKKTFKNGSISNLI